MSRVEVEYLKEFRKIMEANKDMSDGTKNLYICFECPHWISDKYGCECEYDTCPFYESIDYAITELSKIDIAKKKTILDEPKVVST